MSKYAIHIGLKPTHLLNAQRVLGDLATIDHDGWNTWGEAPDTDINDPDTFHVVVGPFGGRALAGAVVDYLRDTWADTLVPIDDYPRRRGEPAAHIILTDWDDWSTLDGEERAVQNYDLAR